MMMSFSRERERLNKKGSKNIALIAPSLSSNDMQQNPFYS